jgi:peptide/nickel transport system permease protein
MVQMVARKALPLILVLLAVSFLTYLLVDLLPGDPVLQLIGPQNVSPENLAAVRADLRLDDPLPARYASWLGDALRGDLGRSYQSGQPVTDSILRRLPVTAEIAVLSLLITLLVAVPLGAISAYRAGGLLDKVVTGATFGLLSVPNFILALLLLFVFALRFDVLPATGWTSLTADPVANLKAAVLPALTLAAANIAVSTRLLRSDMIATLQEDHVLLARSKGLSTGRILFRHVLRPSSFSLLTVAGLEVGRLLGGAVIVEEIFAVPGVGRLLIGSIYQRDLVVVQGVVLFIAVVFVLVNFAIDLLYSSLDPRIRQGARRALT